MHTYLLRLLVAAVTFTVGLAVSAIPFLHTSKVTEFNYQRRHDCSKRYFEPSVGVRQDASEPLRVTYVGPGGSIQNGDVPTARLLVQNLSGRDVSNFSLNYISGWRHSRTRGSGSIQSDLDTRGSLLRAGESTMVDVNATQGQMYWVWLSSVEFADGSDWNNSQYGTFIQQY
jgi:hypothetical protein